MGLAHLEYLAVPAGVGNGKVFGCRKCRTHLTTSQQIESKNFNGAHGRAYLFTMVTNVTTGKVEDRSMTTGLHTVRDVMCAKCGETLGWLYIKAFESAQRYKEGKYILEKAMWTEVQ